MVVKRTRLPSPRRPGTPPTRLHLIQATEAARMLGVRPSWFHKLRRRRDMPLREYQQPGTSFAYFDIREVRSLARLLWEQSSGVTGEHNGRAKLTATQVRALRSRARSGDSESALSRHFGVSRRTVGRIVRGEIWSHVA